MASNQDARWLAAAAALAERARPLSRPNPPVGAIIVADGIVAGRGWTNTGGRPHAEAIALEQAGDRARGATLYVTLEPCAHHSERGPACADLVAAAGLARVVIGVEDPDERTRGRGIEHLRQAEIAIACLDHPAARESLAGYLSIRTRHRPHVTLKLALSLDGCIATASGESQWITGPASRAHAHRERARADAILVGGETMRADAPGLDVRLPSLEHRSPRRFVLTRGEAPGGWEKLDITALDRLEGVQHLFVEGGAGAAAAFLAADLVDCLLLYRAPILIGDGLRPVDSLGLGSLADAHGRWQLADRRHFTPDTLEIYDRIR